MSFLFSFFAFLLICVPLFGVILNIWLNRKVFVEPDGDSDLEGSGAETIGASSLDNSALPFVSVLVPARNEEVNIRRCVESLMGQTYANMEIIVLDDESTDSTPKIIEELRSGGDRAVSSVSFSANASNQTQDKLRLICGRPLPEGWVGKCWACHQLAEAARGEVLVFTDADTAHSPGSVACLVQDLRATNATLLSYWPDQETGGWSERLILPLGYLIMVGLLPLWFLNVMESHPRLAARIGPGILRLFGIANGQCLVFLRSVYWELGGHRALKDHLVEDAAFGSMVAGRVGMGARLVNRDGRKWIRCRMYRSFGELWEGFSKNLRPVFETGVIRFLLWGVWVTWLLLLPFGLVFIPGVLRWVGLAGILLIMGIRVWLTKKYRTSWWSAVLHPVAIVLATLIALNSWRLWAGRGVMWRGRKYAKDEVMTNCLL